ncbi:MULTISPECIES: Crp/Fnr family transcriptional regulator [Spongiibacter]|jgi:CRP/FNR family cyclic AMP-dependent transcriptional regulator|uniref:Crp/Fnr family transcriptional regulator n=3 Tax=Spongiibacteraceae TaxID=1706375 RepID=UPI000480CA06|nr:MULTISPECIES: Crp/Fnr family transcriptional regulator [Spongiibacter]MAK43615.1 Crp/Fnr family transcriptional regulator [Spongiibacter sp.]MBM7422990.1 CRP/FNR family cyclic AMP-dependent transcriptional regulator [Spongiibacter marinus]
MSIENVDLFDGLSPDELKLLRDTSILREFAKNTVLIHEGDVADSLYVVETGRVKVYCSDKSGKDFVLNILESGDYFGELALLDDDRRSASVRAMDATQVRIIYKEDFKAIMDMHPNITRILNKNLTRRIRKLTNDVKSLALQDVYGRVVKVLTGLAEPHGEEGQMKINEKLTQQEIADRVGSSREMVARILKDLTIGDYIEVEGRHIILKKKLPESY